MILLFSKTFTHVHIFLPKIHLVPCFVLVSNPWFRQSKLPKKLKNPVVNSIKISVR